MTVANSILLFRAQFLHLAKYNLGKVNLEAMLVSRFPSYSRGGPMPLAGAPRDLYTQLLACSSSQSVVAIIATTLFACQFVLWFFPSLPPSWCGLGKYWVGKYSTELFSVMVPGGGRSEGLPWIPPSHARALPSSTNFEGTNAQAHLLVMSLNKNHTPGLFRFRALN